MGPVTIDLLRHGPVDGPAALYGSTNVPLKPEAIAQMNQQLSRFPVEYAQIISSPLRRCEAFASHYAQSHSLPLKLLDSIKEYEFGELDGVAFESTSEVQKQQLALFWQHPAAVALPQAESYPAFQSRVAEGWNAITKQAEQYGNILVVTHGGVIRAIVAHLLNIPLAQVIKRIQPIHSSLTRVEFYDTPENAQLRFIGVPPL